MTVSPARVLTQRDLSCMVAVDNIDAIDAIAAPAAL